MASAIWIILMLLLLVIEAATLGLTTLWFAIGCLVACIASLLHAPIVFQIILFVFVSVLLLCFTRPLAQKYLNKTRLKSNTDALIGKKVVVLYEINNLCGTGRVSVTGMDWAARSINDEDIFPQDSIVKIIKVDGVKLIVEKIEEKEN